MPIDRWNDTTPFYTLFGTDLPVQTVIFRLLLVLMLLDVVLGFSRACIGLKVSSAATYQGMIKRAGIILLILLATIMEGVVGVLFKVTYPLIFNESITVFFIWWELVSITKNLAAVGVPIPKTWVAMLEELRQVDDKAAAQLVKIVPDSAPIPVKTADEPLTVAAKEPLPVKTQDSDRLKVTETPDTGHNGEAAKEPQEA